MTLFAIDGYNATVPRGVAEVKGSIVIACRRDLERLQSRSFRKGEYRRRLLFDPQVYLAELDATRYAARCATLASYSWFETGDLDFKRTGRSRTQTNWSKKKRRLIKDYWTGRAPENVDEAALYAANVQHQLGCEAIILAGPLTTNPNTDLHLELEWLDRGIDVTKKVNTTGVPVLATVALSDRVLTGIAPFENALLDTVIDQVSARHVDGVYIVLTTSTSLYYLADGDTVGALLRLVDGFKRAGLRHIVVNYATVAGLLALAVGADIICTGWYKSERRLNLAELADDEAKDRLAYPAYYCHQLASEINISQDLPRIAKAGRLDDYADVTRYSEPLLRAIREGIDLTKGDAIPDWQYQGGTTPASRGHFASAVGREAGEFVRLPADARIERARRWLASAVRLADELPTVVSSSENDSPLHQRTEVSHQRSWQQAFESFLLRKDS